jgi:phenylalanine-4-hydroxylase
MRNHKHITYTPSPDIVHEAAGHAPIIANKDYAQYLINYGEIAIKSIMSSEDLNIYYAIRELSDIKENINATQKDINQADKKLKKAIDSISYTSESAMLARMNWWTVEYGLIGDIKNPKIYGAGLLSSVAESENCLKNKVKKIEFNMNCIDYSYDITEQQPQLFVTPNYKFLSKELKKLSKKMAYKLGGLNGLSTAKKAKTLCTVELDNLIQVSGIIDNIISDKNNQINFISLIGPSQICLYNKELTGHGSNYHSHGYSSPIGKLEQFNKPIHELNNNEIKKLNLYKNELITLNFKNNISVNGKIKNILKKSSRILLITFKECTVKYNQDILFKPDWGNYDLICGNKITSVFGGPSDSEKFYIHINSDDNKYNEYNIKQINNENQVLDKLFQKINNYKGNIPELYKIYQDMMKKSIDDWLLKYQFLELTSCNRNIDWINTIYLDLEKISKKDNDLSRAIKRGLNLFS